MKKAILFVAHGSSSHGAVAKFISVGELLDIEKIIGRRELNNGFYQM